MVNWDEALAYDTFKVVRVKDKWLGFIKLLCQLMIFIYIFAKVIVIDQAYLVHDSPSGSARISLQSPKTPINLAEEPFCPNNPAYKYEAGCNGSGSSWDYPLERCLPKPASLKDKPIACQIWDEHGARYPADELNAIFITTRIISEEQDYNCGKENTNSNPLIEPTCNGAPYTPDEETQGVYFLAGIQNYTMGIQHTFFAQSEAFAERFRGNSRDYQGSIILDPKNPKTSKRYFNQAAEDDTPDIITVGELLRAGNINLSDLSKDKQNSLQYSGVVVLVLVRYTNSKGIFHPEPIEPFYEYTVRHVVHSDYKLFESRSIATDEGDRRLVLKRAGPKFVFIVTGDFGQFSFQTLLIQCCSAMGLLSLSTLLVELLMLRVMKWRKHYSAAKFEETNDFSQLYEQGDDNTLLHGNDSTNQLGDTNILANEDWGSQVGSNGNYSKFK